MGFSQVSIQKMTRVLKCESVRMAQSKLMIVKFIVVKWHENEPRLAVPASRQAIINTN